MDLPHRCPRQLDQLLRHEGDAQSPMSTEHTKLPEPLWNALQRRADQLQIDVGELLRRAAWSYLELNLRVEQGYEVHVVHRGQPSYRFHVDEVGQSVQPPNGAQDYIAYVAATANKAHQPTPPPEAC